MSEPAYVLSDRSRNLRIKSCADVKMSHRISDVPTDKSTMVNNKKSFRPITLSIEPLRSPKFVSFSSPTDCDASDGADLFSPSFLRRYPLRRQSTCTYFHSVQSSPGPVQAGSFCYSPVSTPLPESDLHWFRTSKNFSVLFHSPSKV